MAIVKIPGELLVGHQLTCAICHVRLLLDKATAGMFDINNRQTFACVSHFSEVELLICGWADFMAVERAKYERRKRKLGAEYAWLNH